MPDLDDLWDFHDPSASEGRFAARVTAAATEAERVEACTQLARAQGLQRRFEDAHRTLDEVERALSNASPRVRVRYLLERGRILNSSGTPDRALPVFVEAYECAAQAGDDALAVDAAHMIAIAVPEANAKLTWNRHALAVAEASTDPRARRWRASLRNNIGWALFDVGRYAEALEEFRRAVDLRAEQGDPREHRIARWAVARTQRAMGDLEEALAQQRELLREGTSEGREDPFVLEELGECLHALGRADAARPHFQRAYELLSRDEWFAANEPARLARLADLAGVRG